MSPQNPTRVDRLQLVAHASPVYSDTSVPKPEGGRISLIQLPQPRASFIFKCASPLTTFRANHILQMRPLQASHSNLIPPEYGKKWETRY